MVLFIIARALRRRTALLAKARLLLRRSQIASLENRQRRLVESESQPRESERRDTVRFTYMQRNL